MYVIGAGPAGLSASMVLSRAGVAVQLVERSDLLGGKVNSHHDSGYSLEHGVHGWWMNYLNFDRLLRWSDIDPQQALKEADGSALIMPDGRLCELCLLPWNVPSPLFFILQILRAPYLSVWDLFRLAPFAVHVLAFSHAQDYTDYDGFSFQQLMEVCGVSPRVQKLLLESFILSFDFTVGARVSAACGLSGLQFYILPDQQSILARWARRLPADAVFGPIGDNLQKRGVTIRTSSGLHSLKITDGKVAGLWLDQSPGATPVPSTQVVLAQLDVGTIPVTGFRKVELAAGSIWVGRHSSGYAVLSARCTHEGCTVDWKRDAEVFVCPCHGGRFDAEGRVLQGPPKLPLDTYASRLNGNIVAQTDGLPTELRHNIGHLDTTPVIVVRVWFDASLELSPEIESAVTPEFEFIDNFFHLNSFDEQILPEGQVVEAQAYKAAANFIDATDEVILSAALADLSKINAGYIRQSVRHYAINRLRTLFTRYGPGQNQFRPTEDSGIEGLYLAGDWTQAPWSVWMMERGVVSGLRAANAVLQKRGLPTVKILQLPPEGLLLRLSRWLCLILRLTVFRRLPMSRPPTEEELMVHSERDHKMNGWVALIAAVSLFLPLFSPEFAGLSKIWPFPFIAISLYFFCHTEPDVRYARGSWLRAWADSMTLQHRVMTVGSIAGGFTELGLAFWHRNDLLFRGLFPVGLIAAGVIFYNHHHGDKALIGRQHKIMAFVFVVTGLTALGARFVPMLSPLQYAWPMLLGLEAYLFISYTEHEEHIHGADSGDSHGGGHGDDGHDHSHDGSQ